MLVRSVDDTVQVVGVVSFDKISCFVFGLDSLIMGSLNLTFKCAFFVELLVSIRYYLDNGSCKHIC